MGRVKLSRFSTFGRVLILHHPHAGGRFDDVAARTLPMETSTIACATHDRGIPLSVVDIDDGDMRDLYDYDLALIRLDHYGPGAGRPIGRECTAGAASWRRYRCSPQKIDVASWPFSSFRDSATIWAHSERSGHPRTGALDRPCSE